jgi:hypothetical protein
MERTFSGEHEAAQIVRWLNAVEDRPWLNLSEIEESKKRLLDVISSIRKLTDLAVHSQACSPGTREDPADELSDAMHELNLKLRRYASAPTFFDRQFGDPSNTRPWVIGKILLDDSPADESLAISAVLSLANQDRLERLQVCGCGSWYYAKFSHQRFCSPECRIKYWEKSEERKQQKRDRARNNYVYKKAYKGK